MTHDLAAILLAAGHARRFGDDKLLRALHGAPIVQHAIDAARAAPVSRIVIVHRPGATMEQLCRDAALSDPRISSLTIESDALSASLSAGLHAVAGGAFVFLGDMPFIPHEISARLAVALGDRFAAVPVCAGQQGHPVLLSARAAALAARLSGDQGAGALLRRHANEVVHLETDDDGVLADVDTPGDYARAARRPRA